MAYAYWSVVTLGVLQCTRLRRRGVLRRKGRQSGAGLGESEGGEKPVWLLSNTLTAFNTQPPLAVQELRALVAVVPKP